MDDDVEAVEVTEGCSEGQAKPLMRLFKRLIGNDNKQNTVLTNPQIINILKKEFGIETEYLHALEVDIYLNIMKKYLKEWPQWDEFDTIINNLKSKGQHDEISKILVLKYMDLKDYVKGKLEMARPLAQEMVWKIRNQAQPDVEEEFLKVVLEVNCSREQLNSLFYRHPHPGKDYTIFNTAVQPPWTISLGLLEYKDMFFWWNIGIEIKTSRNALNWQTMHESKLILVNKKLNFPRRPIRLKQVIYATEKPAQRQRMFSLISINHFLDRILKLSYKNSYVPIYTMELIIQVIKKDIEFLPQLVDGTSKFRRYLSKYAFVRYFSTEVPEAANDEKSKNYDLQLEEVIKPRSQIHLSLTENSANFKTFTISLKCFACATSYSGHNMLETLKQHILADHFAEQDWKCTNCHEDISMLMLARKRHYCS